MREVGTIGRALRRSVTLARERGGCGEPSLCSLPALEDVGERESNRSEPRCGHSRRLEARSPERCRHLVPNAVTNAVTGSDSTELVEGRDIEIATFGCNLASSQRTKTRVFDVTRGAMVICASGERESEENRLRCYY